MELVDRKAVAGGPDTPELIGATADAIATAEDREQFKYAMQEIGLRRARLRDGPQPGRGGGRHRTHRPAGRGPPCVHPRRQGNRHRCHARRLPPDRGHGTGRQSHQRDPHRTLHRRVEGVRARGHARPGGQLRRRLLDREPRPHGRPHRRLHHGGARPDAQRRRVPGHARRGVRLHPPGGRGDRRLERAVRTRPDQRRHGHHRDEPAGEPVVRPGVEGHRVPDRQDRRQAGRRLHARRDPERHHPQDARQLRAHHRLRRHQGAPLGVREVPHQPGRPRNVHAIGGRGHGHRPDLPGVAPEGAAQPGGRAGGPELRPGRGGPRPPGRRRAGRPGGDRHAGPPLPARGGAAPGDHDRGTGRADQGRPLVPRPDPAHRRGAGPPGRLGAGRVEPRGTGSGPSGLGFADAQLAWLWGVEIADVRRRRLAAGVRPTYKTVDTLRRRVRGGHAVPLLDLRGRGRGRRPAAGARC